MDLFLSALCGSETSNKTIKIHIMEEQMVRNMTDVRKRFVVSWCLWLVFTMQSAEKLFNFPHITFSSHSLFQCKLQCKISNWYRVLHWAGLLENTLSHTNSSHNINLKANRSLSTNLSPAHCLALCWTQKIRNRN